MAFADEDGEPYDLHLTDDLQSYGTLEAIDFKFSLPHSNYILIWRRDGKKFTSQESKYVTKYVRDDMKDFISDGDPGDGEKWHYKVAMKMIDEGSCLILAWDKMKLPEQYDGWDEFSFVMNEFANEESEEISKPGSLHERELAIYEGKLNPELLGENIVELNHKLRSHAYDRYQIPSDNVLREYFMCMKEKNYVNACELLAAHYNIVEPLIEMKDNLPGTVFVYYDFVNHTIVFSPLRMPEFWQQVPTLLAGFFRHLALSKDWKFSVNPSESIQREKDEADRFVQESLNRLIDIGLDPRKY